jgi:hypothetical protein
MSSGAAKTTTDYGCYRAPVGVVAEVVRNGNALRRARELAEQYLKAPDRDKWDDNRLLQNDAALHHLADLMNELRRDSLVHHGISSESRG